jgi:hypothetical protein
MRGTRHCGAPGDTLLGRGELRASFALISQRTSMDGALLVAEHANDETDAERDEHGPQRIAFNLVL